MPDAAPPPSPKDRPWSTGPRIPPHELDRIQGVEKTAAESASWRGWVIGLLCVLLLAGGLPYLDFVLRGTILTNSMFPSSSVFFLFILSVLVTVGVARFQSQLGLKRQDLILVFCMAMVVNAIPGCGFWTFWITATTGGVQMARPENHYLETIVAHIPPQWLPEGRADSRAIEWFYMGLPQNEKIPWGAWAGPYARWALALVLLFGMLFALCGLLRRQWSDRERIAFPLAQLPEDMVSGFGGSQGRAFLADRVAWFGILLVFLFHSWNALGDYFTAVPRIPIRNDLTWYLTEEPWRAFMPVWAFIYLSVIGLTYLLSLEVAFSLWFYWVVLKLGYLVAVKLGYGTTGFDFGGTSGFIDQGNGALLGLAVGGFWLARGELKNSLMQALGLRPMEEDPTDYSPRVLWLVLLACYAGSVAWLMAFGISFLYAAMIVVFMVVAMTALTRLSCEGGLFYMQMYVFPVHLVQISVTPSVLGAAEYVKLTIWNRVMIGDWFRVLFMPNIMNAIHLSSRTGLKRRSVMAGMAVAVVVTLVVSFFSFFGTAYTNPGGAHDMSWYLSDFPNCMFPEMNATVSQINTYAVKEKQAEEKGEKISASETPDVAKRDLRQLSWFAVGAGWLWLSVFLRSFLFWFPHPIGYVMWMSSFPHNQLWLSFFLGWAIKAGVLKYGGSRVYLRAKRFFIGVVVGEAIAVITWKLVAAIFHRQDGYMILG
jgi:hypothetical protein